jgi:hypothetical protein
VRSRAWKFLDSPEKDRLFFFFFFFFSLFIWQTNVGVIRGAVFKPAASNVTSPHDDELIVVFSFILPFSFSPNRALKLKMGGKTKQTRIFNIINARLAHFPVALKDTAFNQNLP